MNQCECKHGAHIHNIYTEDDRKSVAKAARAKGIPKGVAEDATGYANMTLVEIAAEWDMHMLDLLALIAPLNNSRLVGR